MNVCEAVALLEPSGECLNWPRPGGPYGHGTTTISGRPGAVYRLIYEYLLGPVAAGLELDHLCRNGRCCNVMHLEPVTHAENMRRTSYLVAKAYCPKGHDLHKLGVYTYPSGKKNCRECRRMAQRALRRQARESVPA